MSCYHNKWLCFPNVPQQCTIHMSVSPIRLFVIKTTWLTTYCQMRRLFFKFHFIFISNYQILNTMQVLLQHKPPSTFYQHSNHTKYNLICIYKAISCTGYPRHCQYSFIMAAKKVRWLPLARKKIEEKSLRGQVIQRKTLSKAQVSQLISQS